MPNTDPIPPKSVVVDAPPPVTVPPTLPRIVDGKPALDPAATAKPLKIQKEATATNRKIIH
jgi:hypothetical protein